MGEQGEIEYSEIVSWSAGKDFFSCCSKAGTVLSFLAEEAKEMQSALCERLVTGGWTGGGCSLAQSKSSEEVATPATQAEEVATAAPEMKLESRQGGDMVVEPSGAGVDSNAEGTGVDDQPLQTAVAVAAVDGLGKDVSQKYTAFGMDGLPLTIQFQENGLSLTRREVSSPSKSRAASPTRGASPSRSKPKRANPQLIRYDEIASWKGDNGMWSIRTHGGEEISVVT